MGQPLRLELPKNHWHVSSRTINSRLWFLHNKALEEEILAFLAKNQERHGVIIYLVILMGNHFHLLADFPNGNKSAFMRDWNSMTARLVKKHQTSFEGGPVFARRFSSEIVPLPADAERLFLYIALNPVSSGIVPTLGSFPGYNACFDAIRGKERTYTLVDWHTYLDRKRYNKKLKPKDFERTYTLKFSRLPGYEEMDAKEYERTMRKKIEERRQAILETRKEEKKGFLGERLLRRQAVGSKPKNTKKSTRRSTRPLVLCGCEKTEKYFLDLYFEIRDRYTECVEMVRAGVKNVEFPKGTYPVPLIQAFDTG